MTSPHTPPAVAPEAPDAVTCEVCKQPQSPDEFAPGAGICTTCYRLAGVDVWEVGDDD